MTTRVLLGFLLMTSVFCGEALASEGVDPGQPLFLTPLIESGQLDRARQLSTVSGLPSTQSGDVAQSYSGYLTVNKTYNSNLFFWYFPAQVAQPTGVPILLWLQGGPGASSLFGLFVEHGPFLVTKDLHLKSRDYAWTSQYHVIYIDQPVGTGFSFTDQEDGYARNEDDVADNLYEALIQFFTLFPDLQQSDFYVTGESYGGKYVPAISYKLDQEQPKIIKFKGMAIGNGLIDPLTQSNYGDYLYQLGLLDRNQRQYFMDQQVKLLNFIRQKSWHQALDIVNKLVLGVFNVSSSFNNDTGMAQHVNILYTVIPEDMSYFLAYVVQDSVRKAIHVGNQKFNDGMEVLRHLIEDLMQSTAPRLVQLLEHQRKVLIYNGQLDVIVAYPLTANFLWNLEWSGQQSYRSANRTIWKVARDDQEVAGYVRQVGNFTLVMVRNAGHMVPYDQPRVALDMISRFIQDKPFALKKVLHDNKKRS